MSELRKVQIATPTYDGKVTAEFATALLDTVIACAQQGILVSWNVVRGVPLVALARNRLVADFLDSDFDELVFIDADVRWWPEGFLRLLSWDKDIVAGAYPYKQLPEAYPIEIKVDSFGALAQCPDTGLLSCDYAPTGFMRIRRQVFTRLAEGLGGADEIKVIEQIRDGGRKPEYLCFFDTARRGTEWLGEDVEFCRRWRESCEGQIWSDPEIALEHSGEQVYAGHLGDFLRARAAPPNARPKLSVVG